MSFIFTMTARCSECGEELEGYFDASHPYEAVIEPCRTCIDKQAGILFKKAIEGLYIKKKEQA